jgi:hypothetical protein
MSTGSEASKQFAHTGDGDSSGGNSSGGKTMQMPRVHMVQPFQGKSGQPDNQDTSRPKGTT